MQYSPLKKNQWRDACRSWSDRVLTVGDEHRYNLRMSEKR
jgi:hypothetical protein